VVGVAEEEVVVEAEAEAARVSCPSRVFSSC